MAVLEVLPGFANVSFLWKYLERRREIDEDVAAVSHRAGKSLVAIESTPHFRVSVHHRCCLWCAAIRTEGMSHEEQET